MNASDITWEVAPSPWPTYTTILPDAPADDALAALARSEQRLLDRVVDLAVERDRYRELSQQFLHALHAVTKDRDRLRELRRVERAQQGRAA